MSTPLPHQLIRKFDSLFEDADTTASGSHTAEDALAMHRSLHFCELPLRHVQHVMKRMCSDPLRVAPDEFVKLQGELQKQCRLLESIRWDFESLDFKHEETIPASNVHLLFRNYRHTSFDPQEVDSFLQQRKYPNHAVSYWEIAEFLCDHPTPPPRLLPAASTLVRKDSQPSIFPNGRPTKQHFDAIKHRDPTLERFTQAARYLNEKSIEPPLPIPSEPPVIQRRPALADAAHPTPLHEPVTAPLKPSPLSVPPDMVDRPDKPLSPRLEDEDTPNLYPTEEVT
eukprot:gnl/Trimastix_PCT/3410.p1 GENE.gnl/Trimastix_PCT/3410~~gnl/Trimastix_PCT/3410.p1  ORF type:complete len:283 (+),score=35.22 gnl/Trimastix_PCT/3410:27-875(+)